MVRASLAFGDSVVIRPVANIRFAIAPSGRRIVFVGPDGDENVMCLSCHRAHASGWDDALRWNDSAMAHAPSPGKKATSNAERPTSNVQRSTSNDANDEVIMVSAEDPAHEVELAAGKILQLVIPALFEY